MSSRSQSDDGEAVSDNEAPLPKSVAPNESFDNPDAVDINLEDGAPNKHSQSDTHASGHTSPSHPRPAHSVERPALSRPTPQQDANTTYIDVDDDVDVFEPHGNHDDHQASGLNLEPQPLTNASYFSIALFVTLIVLIIVLSRHMGQRLVQVTVFVPSVVLVDYLRRNQYRAISVNEVIGKFTTGFAVVAFIVFTAAIGAFLLISSIWGLMTHRTHLSGLTHYVVLVLLGVPCLTIPEESMKAFLTRREHHHTLRRNPKFFVLSALCTACGYGTMQAIWVSNAVYGARDATIAEKFSWTVGLMVNLLLHMLSGYHIGMVVAKHVVIDKTFASIPTIIPAPVAARTIYFYCLLLLPIVSPILASCVFLFYPPLYLVVVKAQERRMPANYLAKSGYMNLWGYGVLLDVDQPDHDDQRPTVAARTTTTGEPTEQ